MKRLFSLSPRLRTVAELVPDGTLLADIGTDHGRLPVWLLVTGHIPGAIATDLREKPLARAVDLARQWGVSQKVEFRLCDGLSQVDPSRAQTVTITGMGGETIAAILQAAPWTSQPGRSFLLQPMSGADGLRRWLSESGFVIDREWLVEEEGTIYLILRARPGEDVPYSEGEIWVGRQRWGDEAPLRARYLDQELKKLRRAYEMLAQAVRPEDRERRDYFERTALQVEELKKEWDGWQQ